MRDYENSSYPYPAYRRIWTATNWREKKSKQWRAVLILSFLINADGNSTMSDFRPNEIVDMLLILGSCGRNYLRAENLYRREYPHRRHPSRQTIQALERRARSGWMIRQRQRFRNVINDFDGPHGARNLAILAMIAIDPHVSVRVISERLGFPRSTVHRVLRSARLHPYRIQFHQDTPNPDPLRRIAFCRWALRRIGRYRDFFRFVMFSDESTFNNRGQTIRWNFRYWSDQNPHWVRQIDHQHRWSLNVWCGIVNGQIIGPYFFEGNVNAARYLDFLQNELPVLLEDLDFGTRQQMWFQQDGAPAHWACVVRNYLDATFGRRWIGRDGPVSWPPRSPDLTAPDFFLWGYLKDVVYRRAPTTRENMKERIRAACRAVPRDVLLRTVDAFERRVQTCLNMNGGIFEHL